MKARVATFETTDHELLKRWVAELQDLAEDGMPRGVPATATLVFYSEDRTKVLSINLFETEGALAEGDAILLEMGPPDRGRTEGASGVEVFDVVVNLRR